MYTQEQLAEKIDKSAGYIAAIESKRVKKILSMDTFFDIANVLDVEPYKLLEED